MEALRRRHGVDAVASAELEPDLRGFDAVHLFGIVRPQEVWLQARNARRQGKPVILSPVYCDVWEFERHDRDGAVGALARVSNRDVLEAAKAAGRAVNNREFTKGILPLVLKGFSKMQLDIVRWSALFLPNSQSEWDRVVHDLGIDVAPERVAVVPNGVDLDTYTEDLGDSPPEHLADFAGCVLCVGRVEARKNQLNVVQALHGSGLQLVLAGPPAPNQRNYEKRVRAAADANVRVLGAVSDLEKRWLYRLARVHVLASWLETTGLSTLEAAMYDCSLVVSPNGDTREYFEGHAEFCDPGDQASIRTAVLRAMDRPPDTAFVDEIRRNFTWDAAADATYAAYRRVISQE